MKNRLQNIIKNYCEQNPQINLNSPSSQEALVDHILKELRGQPLEILDMVEEFYSAS